MENSNSSLTEVITDLTARVCHASGNDTYTACSLYFQVTQDAVLSIWFASRTYSGVVTLSLTNTCELTSIIAGDNVHIYSNVSNRLTDIRLQFDETTGIGRIKFMESSAFNGIELFAINSVFTFTGRIDYTN